MTGYAPAFHVREWMPSISRPLYLTGMVSHVGRMGERWRQIPSFPRYQASDGGRVRSIYRILRDEPDHRGNPRVHFYAGGVEYTRHLDRVVLEAFTGVCPVSSHPIHIDGDPGNCALSNLTWAPGVDEELDHRGRPYRVMAGGKLRCAQCGDWKLPDEFYHCARTHHDRSPYCKACDNRARNARRRRRASAMSRTGEHK